MKERRRRDSNPRIRALQAPALPLGHVAVFNNIVLQHCCTERAMGFEPTTFSLARRRSTAELRPHSMSLQECRGPDLNWGPTPFQGVALPTELPRHIEQF